MFFVWLVFYGSMILLSKCFQNYTVWAVPVGVFISTAVLVIGLLLKSKEKENIFKIVVFADWKKQLFFIPYILPAIYNFFDAGVVYHPIHSLLLIVSTAVLEEIVYRGILLNYLCKKGYLFGVVVSSVIFSVMHLVNLESGYDTIYVIYQVVFALAMGFALSGISVSCRSIMPCIVIHLLVNITAGNSDSFIQMQGVFFWICIAVSIICGVRSLLYLKETVIIKKGY